MKPIKANDETYMRRALQLARNGQGRTLTNPMVGAVIVARGRIIGEGFHRRYGCPHAEVNAVRSVSAADRPLLREATIYVTLEPCSHYGKTPPCSKLLIDEGIPRVVIGSLDPFPEVSGRGVKLLREAGCDVKIGVLEKECRALNRRFMHAHESGRPYVRLKWAQSADGFLASKPGSPRAIFSSPLSMTLMHRERAMAQAIAVGVNTIIADNPRLKTSLWPGSDPLPVSRESERIPADSNFALGKHLLRGKNEPLPDFLRRLYSEEKINTLMVEGGAETLTEFIKSGLFDEIRLEISPLTINEGIKAPDFPLSTLKLCSKHAIRENILMIFRR